MDLGGSKVQFWTGCLVWHDVGMGMECARCKVIKSVEYFSVMIDLLIGQTNILVKCQLVGSFPTQMLLI